MNAIQRVGRALGIVVRQREALRLLHQLGPETEHQPLADVGLHELVGERLQLAKRRDREQEPDGDREQGGGRSDDGRGQQRVKKAGERPRPEHGVDGDLERHGVQQRDRARQQPDPEQDREVEPVGPSLPHQAAVQREVTHLGSSPHCHAHLPDGTPRRSPVPWGERRNTAAP